MEMFIMDNSKMVLKVETGNTFLVEAVNMKENGLMEKCMVKELFEKDTIKFGESGKTELK
jgi:hypothetical protein